MKKYLIAIIVAAAAFACRKEATPIELSNVCAADNEKKYIITSGFLKNGGSIFCSNIGGGRLECGIDVAASADGSKVFSAEIEQGSGANQIEKLSSGYKREDVKIRDNTGNVISFSDKVKVTGQMSIVPDGSVCFMKVDRIEKE